MENKEKYLSCKGCVECSFEGCFNCIDQEFKGCTFCYRQSRKCAQCKNIYKEIRKRRKESYFKKVSRIVFDANKHWHNNKDFWKCKECVDAWNEITGDDKPLEQT